MKVSGEEYSRRLESYSDDTFLLLSSLLKTKKTGYRAMDIVAETETEEEVDMKIVCKALEDERKIAREEGHESGLAEGREAERKAIASQMKKEGFSDEIIAKVLQVSLDNVRQLFPSSQ